VPFVVGPAVQNAIGIAQIYLTRVARRRPLCELRPTLLALGLLLKNGHLAFFERGLIKNVSLVCSELVGPLFPRGPEEHVDRDKVRLWQ
jgi:hypothetical protein